MTIAMLTAADEGDSHATRHLASPGAVASGAGGVGQRTAGYPCTSDEEHVIVGRFLLFGFVSSTGAPQLDRRSS